MTSIKRITHLSSVHPRNDIRIFSKECFSLANAGFSTTLIIADGKGNEQKDRIAIVDVGSSNGRLNRMCNITRRVFNAAVELDSEVYHFHDPELIPIGLKLKRLGKIVIFDSHEDVPRQMLSKPYLHPFLLKRIAGLFSLYENYACRKFDGIITATSFIRDKFLKINPNTLDVNNYPLIGELDSAVAWKDKRPEVCYVGGITAARGIREVVRACALLQSNARLNLAGDFSVQGLENEVKASPGWSRVNALGYVDRGGVREVLGQSVAGLVTFLPLPNHIDAQPNKMFEYMSSGIPVIASNFPLWREIIEGNECGLCVNPLDPKAIAEAIDYLVINSDIARRMGENGRQAVLQRYNWAIEEKKLLGFYGKLNS